MDNRFRKEETREDIIEIDILEVLKMCLKHWKAIFFSAILAASIFGAYQYYMVGHRYQADATVFIKNTNSVITVSDMQLSSELTDDYRRILSGRATLDGVIRELNLDMSFG